MKSYLILILSIFVIHKSVNASSTTRTVDISLKQDSINPLTFTITVHRLDIFFSFQDSAYVNWGDGTIQGIPIIDTSKVEPGLYFKTYQATHTILSIPLDSFITVSTYGTSRFDQFNNINLGGTQLSNLYVEAKLNLAYFNTSLGKSTPEFNSNGFVRDTLDQIAIYDSQISDADNDSLYIKLDTPLNWSNQIVDQYYFPDQLPGLPASQFTINHSTGVFIWDTPVWGYGGYYVIDYKVSEYRNGIFLSSVMRDMMIQIIPGSVGMKNIIPKNELTLSPNPTTSTVTLQLPTGTKQKTVTVLDLNGKVVLNSKTVTLNLSTLPRGMYFITVQTNDGVWQQKVVVQ